jgi:hypothetical protein
MISLLTPQAGMMKNGAKSADRMKYRWIFIVVFTEQEFRCSWFNRSESDWEGTTEGRALPGQSVLTLLRVNEMPTPVLLPALFVRLGAERLFLSVADRLDVAPIDAGRN